MSKVFGIFKEQWVHRHLIWKLAIYNLKSAYANHYLGVFWTFIQPAMQVALYYVVFGLGLRGDRGDVGELPFIIHLVSGIFPWLFLSSAVNAASSSIQSQLGLVTKMKFPSSILLSITLVNNAISLLLTTAIMVGLSLTFGYSEPLHFLGFFYFLIGSWAFAFGFALITSSLVILVRDMKNVLSNVMRMFFFVTPIFWSLEEANELMHVISSFNPFAYLLMNYRTALVLNDAPIYGDMSDHLYFWSFTLLLIFVGAHVHYRFRDKLVDYL